MPVNIKTSAGPPYYTKKHHHYGFVDDDPVVSPHVASAILELDQALEDGYAVAPLGVCVIKDEALRKGKTPRIFTNLGSAYNVVLKKRLARVLNYMRAHPEFFESYVGVSMSTLDGTNVVRHLKRTGMVETGVWECDVTKMDKSWSGVAWDFWVRFMYALGTRLGVNPDCLVGVESGLKHTRFLIKGDVFSAFWNPSGRFGTIEQNSVFTSLFMRYSFYKQNPHLVDDAGALAYARSFLTSPIPSGGYSHFREHVALVTFGDDVLGVSDPGVFTPDGQVTRAELGMGLTDAHTKSETPTRKKLTEVTFLKRTIVWDEELQRYIFPLIPESMCKTAMCFSTDIKISELDHGAVTLRGLLREAALHGRSFYEAFYAMVAAADAEFGYNQSKHFRLPSFETQRAGMAEAGHTTWVDISTVDDTLLY